MAAPCLWHLMMLAPCASGHHDHLTSICGSRVLADLQLPHRRRRERSESRFLIRSRPTGRSETADLSDSLGPAPRLPDLPGTTGGASRDHPFSVSPHPPSPLSFLAKRRV